MILICISLMASDVETFMCLFAICMSSTVNSFFMPLAYFQIGFFFFKFGSPLYNLDMISLSDVWFTNIFFQSVAFHLLNSHSQSKSFQ